MKFNEIKLIDGDRERILLAEPNRPTALPRPSDEGGIFLGWSPYPTLTYGSMSIIPHGDSRLYALRAESAYRIESHFRGDVDDCVGKRCQFRRYVIDVYLDNSSASEGRLKLELGGDFLYYLGNVPLDGVELTVTDKTDRRGGAYCEAAYFTTSELTLEWRGEPTGEPKRHIAQIMLAFGAWGMSYAEIERRTSDDIVKPTRRFAEAGGAPIPVSANFYAGARPELLPEPYVSDVPEDADLGELLTRCAILADSHVGVRYEWESYDWLDGIYAHLAAIHEETPLDFVVELGDNIDDGYAQTYERDYEIYLKQVKKLTICDAENPIENRREGTIPHYEIKGNHDTSDDTRFFGRKLWYSGRDGHKVAHIAFDTSYGGYPAVNFAVAGNYDSYRSYGILRDDSVEFVEKSILAAEAAGAEQIILYNHFGIAQDLIAPILPESGLGKLDLLCKKHNIRLYFNGHEHNPDYTLRRYGSLFDWDAAMTHDAYATLDLYSRGAVVRIFDTTSHQLLRSDRVMLVGRGGTRSLFEKSSAKT